MGVRVGVANFFLDQSIPGLWALEGAWYAAKTILRCVTSSGICMPNLNSLALIVSEISAFIRTDRQTDMTRATRLVTLINRIQRI